MFGPDHCCSRLRVHLPRRWNFRLNFQPSSIHSLNQLELVRMDIPLSSFFLLKPVSVQSQVRQQKRTKGLFSTFAAISSQEVSCGLACKAA